jgi:hypothetical protein
MLSSRYILLSIFSLLTLHLTAQRGDDFKVWRSSLGVHLTTIGYDQDFGLDNSVVYGAQMNFNTVIPIDDISIMLTSGLLGGYGGNNLSNTLILRPYAGGGVGYRLDDILDDWVLLPRVMGGVDGTGYGSDLDGELDIFGGMNLFFAPGVGIGNEDLTATLSYRATVAGLFSFGASSDGLLDTSGFRFPGNTLTATVAYRRLQLSLESWGFGEKFSGVSIDGVRRRGFTLGANLVIGR